MMNKRTAIALCLLTAFVGVIGPACRRSESSTATPSPASGVAVTLDTPQDAARSVLNCLLAQRAARKQGDTAAAREYLVQLRSMAARDVIMARYKDRMPESEDEREQKLATFVQGWGPIIGYYADGLQMDQLSEPTPTSDPDVVYVQVPAAVGEERTAIRLECCRGTDKQWRVARIDFAEPTATSQPTTSPSP